MSELIDSLSHKPDPSTTKPVYIVKLTDVDKPKSFLYIKALETKVKALNGVLDITGCFISKKEAEKSLIEHDRTIGENLVQIIVPFHRWVETVNITKGKK